MNTNNNLSTYKNIVLNSVRNYSIAGLCWRETFDRVSDFLSVLHVSDSISTCEFDELHSYLCGVLDSVYPL